MVWGPVGVSVYVWRYLHYGPTLFPPHACLSPDRLEIAEAASLLASPEGTQIELLSHLGGGHPEAAFVRGSKLIVGAGEELSVLDLTNPKTPRREAYKVTGGLLVGLDAEGKTAYLKHRGLYLQDMSDLSTDIGRLVVHDGVVFWTDNGKDLWVVDASDPNMPHAFRVELNASHPFRIRTKRFIHPTLQLRAGHIAIGSASPGLCGGEPGGRPSVARDHGPQGD